MKTRRENFTNQSKVETSTEKFEKESFQLYISSCCCYCSFSFTISKRKASSRGKTFCAEEQHPFLAFNLSPESQKKRAKEREDEEFLEVNLKTFSFLGSERIFLKLFRLYLAAKRRGSTSDYSCELWRENYSRKENF